eukprot:scaffold14520_cov63-Phaeocystis_antarctica.AAC.3
METPRESSPAEGVEGAEDEAGAEGAEDEAGAEGAEGETGAEGAGGAEGAEGAEACRGAQRRAWWAVCEAGAGAHRWRTLRPA